MADMLGLARWKRWRGITANTVGRRAGYAGCFWTGDMSEQGQKPPCTGVAVFVCLTPIPLQNSVLFDFSMSAYSISGRFRPCLRRMPGRGLLLSVCCYGFWHGFQAVLGIGGDGDIFLVSSPPPRVPYERVLSSAGYRNRWIDVGGATLRGMAEVIR
jgi:hypothetical protein